MINARLSIEEWNRNVIPKPFSCDVDLPSIKAVKHIGEIKIRVSIIRRQAAYVYLRFRAIYSAIATFSTEAPSIQRSIDLTVG